MYVQAYAQQARHTLVQILVATEVCTVECLNCDVRCPCDSLRAWTAQIFRNNADLGPHVLVDLLDKLEQSIIVEGQCRVGGVPV